MSVLIYNYKKSMEKMTFILFFIIHRHTYKCNEIVIIIFFNLTFCDYY